FVIAMTHRVFDDVGNTIEQHRFEMNHDDGSAVIDLANDADYIRSSVYPWSDCAAPPFAAGNTGPAGTAARISHRQSASLPARPAGNWEYASVPARAGSPPGSSGNTVLVTKFAYDAAGRQHLTTDPMGRDVKSFFDAFGRTLWVAENHDDFDPTSLGTIGDN